MQPWQLRAWERAGLLAPTRSPSGYRLYGAADLEVISDLKADSEGHRLALYAPARQVEHVTEPVSDRRSLVAGVSPLAPVPDGAFGSLPASWTSERAPSPEPESDGEVEKRISRRLAHTVAHAEDLTAVYLELLDCAMEVTGATAGAVSFVNPARQQYFLVAHRGLSDRYVRGIAAWKLHEGLAGKAYGMREPLIVEDLGTNSGVTREIVRLEGLRAYACLPLVRGPRCFGVLEVMTRNDRVFDRRDLESLSTVVTTLSLVAESAMLGAELIALREERLRVFRDWADQAMAASQTERTRVLDALRAEVSDLEVEIAGSDDVPAVVSRAHQRLSEVASELDSADRSWVDLVPAIRDHLIPKVREESGKNIDFSAAATSTELPLSITSRLYVTVSTILGDAARSARSRVEASLYNDDRGLVFEVADDRDGPTGIDAPAGLSAEVDSVLRSIGVAVSQGFRVGFSSVLVLVVPQQAQEGTDVRLTDREWSILHQLSSGLSNRELAKELGISQKTVQNHLTAIYRKIDVVSRGQAIRFALSSPQNPHRDQIGSGTGPTPRA